jgi:3-hydroxyisobutyrate dehydrogenase
VSIVGVIGLGNMGSGMALSLQRAGFEVVGTASTARTRALASEGGLKVVATIAEVASRAEFVVLSLPTPEAVSEVIEGPQGLKTNGHSGQLIIDTTTSDAFTSRRMSASLQEVGIAFVDAPVSGAPELARKGGLAVMLGGAPEDVARAEPVLAAIGSLRVHLGPVGAGNLAKLANNLMAAAHLMVAGEIVALAKKAGLEPDLFLRAINASSGRSFVSERVYPNWILNDRFDLGFTVKLMRKDVRLAQEEIERLGLQLPVVSNVARQWLESGQVVKDEEDITRIVEVTSRRAEMPQAPCAANRPSSTGPGF